MTCLLVWIAEGFGSGRIRKAPGTWGSLVGVAWFALLLLPGHPAVFALGLTLAAALAVPICTVAERALGETDPGRVVLDEIVAVPLCFVPVLLAQQCYEWGHRSVELLIEKIVEKKNPPAVKEISALIPVTKANVDEFGKNWVKWLPR